MPKVNVVFELRCDTERAGELIREVQATIDRFENLSRCPSTSKVGNLRCSLDRGHEDQRCQYGDDSWPNPFVVVIDGVTVALGTKFRSNISGATWYLTGYDDAKCEALLDRDGGTSTYRTGELWNKFDRL
jgi:hypothetical protein